MILISVILETIPVRVIDSFFCRMYTSVDTVKRYQANVDGIPWTIHQTEQAVRDARVCKCGTCIACRVRFAIGE